MTEAITVLVVCTANQCRSPMGEAIARRSLADAGIAASVGSAGTHATPGIPATDAAEVTLRRLGLDLSGHLSRALDDDLVAGASMLWCMERFHVIEVSTRWPEALDRTFTLKDLARRAAASRRHPAEPVAHWLARIGQDRRPADLLGQGAADDVADPTGRSLRHHRRAAEEIARAVDAVVGGLNGPRSGPAPSSTTLA